MKADDEAVDQQVRLRKKRVATGKVRAWKRTEPPMTSTAGWDGVVRVALSNGTVVIVLEGPEESVEPIADRLLRELPEGS